MFEISLMTRSLFTHTFAFPFAWCNTGGLSLSVDPESRVYAVCCPAQVNIFIVLLRFFRLLYRPLECFLLICESRTKSGKQLYHQPFAIFHEDED